MKTRWKRLRRPSRRGFASGLAMFCASALAGQRADGSPDAPPGDWRVIRGEVVTDPAAPPFDGATVNITLEVVTELDSRSQVVASLAIRRVSGGGPKGPAIRFAFGEFQVEEDASYNVRAHVDVDNDGRISPGDLLSGTRYPALLAHKGPERMSIKAELVR